MTRRVLVLNHYAVAAGGTGGTRHVEMFSKLQSWSYLIIAASTNPITGARQVPQPGFLPVRVSNLGGGGVSRVTAWTTYLTSAVVCGLRQSKVDLVYASSPHLLSGVAGYLVSRIRRTPLVLEIRDLWPQVLLDMGKVRRRHPVYLMLRHIEAFLYRAADRIVILSPGIAQVLTGQGVPESRLIYLPNSADPQDFPISMERERLRQLYGMNGRVGVYAGAHGPANGLDLLLDGVSKSTSDVQIHLFGDGLEKQRLRKRVKEENIAGVEFHDPVPKGELGDVYTAADFGIHCLADVPLFRYGVSPNKLFDYLAAGLPILTNSPGVAGDIVAKADAGLCTAPGELSSGLAGIASTPDQVLQEMGRRGQQWLEQNQSRTHVAGRLEEALNEVIGN